jgi:hypothetical protein
MAGYIGSKASVTQVDGYNRSEAEAEFVQDPNDVITVSGSNVGIGVADPIYALEVQGEAGIELYNGTGGGDVLNFRPSLGDASKYNLSISSYDHSGGGVGPADGLSISGFDGVSIATGSSTTRQERMRIDSTGKVGIGTVSPATALDVTGTITAEDITLSSGALNGVTSSNTFKRVVQAGVVDDGTDYTTTTTSAYAAAGPFVSITPQSPGNTKLIGVFSADMRSSVSVNTTDAGTLLRLKYYNGSSYVNTGGARGPLLSSNLAGNVSLDDEISIPFELSNSRRRSDTGDWLIRLYFSCNYANNTSTVYSGTVIFWEVDE